MEISVIIPVYNKQQYLKKILLQLQNQSFPDFECLLIDDGSSDDSGNICDRFAEQDSRFCAFHIPNGGVSHARNFGLDQATGNYITFIDADDEIHRDYLQTLHNKLVSSGADLVIGGYEKFWDTKNDHINGLLPISPGLHAFSQLLPTFSTVQISSGIYGYCWAKLFSADLVTDVRFDESLRLAEDFDFYLRLYPRIKTIYVNDLPYYYYRQEAENSSALVQDSKIDYVAQLKINLRYRDFLKSMNSFTDDNQRIVQQRINDYLYFSLFYCPMTEFYVRFSYLFNLCSDEHIIPTGQGVIKKSLLSCLRHGWKYIARIILGVYGFARNIRNKLRAFEICLI